MNNETRFFQWIAGERKGEVLLLDLIESEDGEVFLKFKDGSRINEKFVAPINIKDMTNMYMAEIDSANNTWTFKEKWIGREEEKWETNAEGAKVCIQPAIPGRKVIQLIPPKPTTPKTSNFGTITNNEEIAQPITELPKDDKIIESNNIDTSDPVYILMSKSKKHDNDITMQLTISMPSESLYDIAKNSFDLGDEKFISYIVNEIDVEEIKTALKDAIKDMYEFQYIEKTEAISSSNSD